MGIFYGLLTALGFGSADFFVTHASRRAGPMRALYAIQLVGLLALLAVVLARREAVPSRSDTWLWAVLLGAVDFAGMYCLYRAFTVGSLAVCSPIAAGYAVVTGMLTLIDGERPPALALLGALALVAGVAVVARGAGAAGGATLAGVPFAVAAAGLLGVFFWGMDDVTAAWGWLWPVVVTRAAMLVCAAALLARSGGLSPRPEPGTGRLLVAAALLDTLALAAFNLGVERAYTTTTTALGSLYSTVAVVLAWLFLGERLGRLQQAGIGAILLGVLLVSA